MPRRAPPTALLLAALVAACAPSRAMLVSQPLAPGRGWLSPLHQDHPLAGKIWDVRGQRFVDEATLVAALAGARTVLLGETHDNADHHVLQARLVRALDGAGRTPAVAFEMLSVEQQPTIDAALAVPQPTADALAAAVQWDRSGWPEFEMYRPVFVAAVDAKLRVIGANLPRKDVRRVVMDGEKALPPAVAARIAKLGPPSPAEREALRKEMEEAHCGELPETQMDPMILGQRARDAQMAESVLAAGAPGGAVLVCGSQHARLDRGVPAYLAGEGGPVVSLAFREVTPDHRAPAEYAEDDEHGALPFDFVVFTPGAEREDPCEGLRAKMRSRKSAPQGKPAPAEPPKAP
ncbi:ChaN family lipoprotein [Anaeromyxobacter oryzae]|uniref:Haem-binding uptake Tiki superfamily ChaN domain-containing protein n=1 Tax=Anaeromyxobacter oryzae TaxID=2918170 RepID=A0ABM7X0T1_9BACT|nr:ChaN family lipoprotein [Anaeromyxobacter oryzae]BDG05415.1 hypothetical protein AMOR_44110 [Anaeromyxobacter oryzae]